MSSSEDKDDAKRVSISKLRPDQWVEIKRLAVKVHDSGMFGKDRLKISVMAFVHWLNHQDGEVVLDADDCGLDQFLQ